MKLQLDQIESRLQSLIEVRLLSALPGFRIEDLVVQRIAEAMKSNLVEGENGNFVAPNVFTLIVHPDNSSKWKEPSLHEALMHSIRIVGEEAGFEFPSAPSIYVSPDPELELNVVNVIAGQQVEPVEDTKGMEPPDDQYGLNENDELPEKAFLIVDGIKVFPLQKIVINIGRRLDNHLVIDDPRVSRTHAQLRAIKGRYIIFDLNSTGGVYVNGQRSKQSVLYPGDVISLAGVPLVFGQDNPPMRPDLADTEPFGGTTIERPTALLKGSDFLRKIEEHERKNNDLK
jgi:pSer/pThr/pTyr-binding forkhead associated (FHA) protein